MAQKKCFIYKLIDPVSNQVRYIGCTTCSIEKRFKEHLRSKENTYKQNWINSLKKQNLKPKIEILEIVSLSNMFNKEKYWIDFHKDSPLTNLTSGGEGIIGFKHSLENKEIISKNTKKGMTLEVCKKISKNKKGKPAHNRKKIKDQYGNVYNSLSEAARLNSVSTSAINQGIKRGKPVKSIFYEVL